MGDNVDLILTAFVVLLIPSLTFSIDLHNFMVVVVLRSPIHANEPSEYNGMLYHTSNRVLNNGIKVIILICMDGTSQYHHHLFYAFVNPAGFSASIGPTRGNRFNVNGHIQFTLKFLFDRTDSETV